MNRPRAIKGRRRRRKFDGSSPDPYADPAVGGIGWDQSASRTEPKPGVHASSAPGLDAQILSLLADPRVDYITAQSAAVSLAKPLQDIETTLASMRQAGMLRASAGTTTRYTVSATRKAELEAEFRLAAGELGESVALAPIPPSETALAPFEEEEPRLPATAGLLSLFLPGTGQLLNGDIGRASLVFAVWSLAWITHLSPVWTFVCLYAGAEAFFTAKIRSMERKLAEEKALGRSTTPDPKKLPSPRPT